MIIIIIVVVVIIRREGSYHLCDGIVIVLYKITRRHGQSFDSRNFDHMFLHLFQRMNNRRRLLL